MDATDFNLYLQTEYLMYLGRSHYKCQVKNIYIALFTI